MEDKPKEEEKKEEQPKEEKKEEEPKKEVTKEEDKKEDEKKETEEPETKEVETAICTQTAEEIGIVNTVEENDLISTEKDWDQLGVKENIKQGLLDLHFYRPSKIQSTTFPLIMKEPRNHVVAQAKNGSGKTAAFGLGVISSIDENLPQIQAVVFAHTRELVNQIAGVLADIAKFTKVKVKAVLAGEERPKNECHIIVITPGHFDNCFMKRKDDRNALNALKILVLDEADYMLSTDITSKVCDKVFKLFKNTGMKVQILFFSATFDESNFRFIKKYYDNANMIELKKEELTLKNVRQMYHYVAKPEDKVSFVEEYLKLNLESERVIIFANKRDNVVKLQQQLVSRGYRVYIAMGGDMDPKNRDETMRRFNKGEIQILITTNLLARGYDEKLVKLVINFDLPLEKNRQGELVADCPTYLHRIGRTGRFGTKGIGLSLCCGTKDVKHIMDISSFYKTKIEEIKSFDELLEELKKLSLEKK